MPNGTDRQGIGFGWLQNAWLLHARLKIHRGGIDPPSMASTENPRAGSLSSRMPPGHRIRSSQHYHRSSAIVLTACYAPKSTPPAGYHTGDWVWWHRGAAVRACGRAGHRLATVVAAAAVVAPREPAPAAAA
jgi:hypothetical protein